MDDTHHNAGNGVATSSADAAAHASNSRSSGSCSSMAEVMRGEGQMMKVPFEMLKRSVRGSCRMVEREVSSVLSSVEELSRGHGSGEGMSVEATLTALQKIVMRLQGLKRKLEESHQHDSLATNRCRQRLLHVEQGLTAGMTSAEQQMTSLSSLSPSSAAAATEQGGKGMEGGVGQWQQQRLLRLLVDALLRDGCSKAAAALASRGKVESLVDSSVFEEAQRVEAALRQRDCSAALAWCAENRSRLKKHKSALEFELRLQEFVELVRSSRAVQAVQYARSHLAAFGQSPDHMKEVQHAMGCLICKPSTDNSHYKRLFDASRWQLLISLFRSDHAAICCLSLTPLLHIHLQAGLQALKTPNGLEEGCSIEDPLSQPEFRQLAANLPFSKRVHSTLVCRISREVMDDHNPPMVLPNGCVYSRQAMEEMARKNGGRITCPRTLETFTFDQLTKAFIF